jgi:catechol 2,3-dioxygenase-like lactoylglutathione lyase family enzyme
VNASDGLEEDRMPWLSRIAPELPVTDLEAAIGFYENKLGFRRVAKSPARDYAIVERDDIALHLFQDSSRCRASVSIHIFGVGLDELEAEFVKRGAKVSHRITLRPWGNRDLRITDPYGNELKFTEPAPNLGGNE